MLHHYNYSSPLSHFLSYHPVQEQSDCSNGQTTPNSLCGEEPPGGGGLTGRYRSLGAGPHTKSFTIAAILGLNQEAQQQVQAAPTDLTTAVVNLSVHQGLGDRTLGSHVSDCSRLQLPVRSHGPAAAGPFPAAPPALQRTVRGMKHLNSGGATKKSSSKSKRVRTIFTPEQLERLEAEFERQQYMVGPERLYLAHTLQLTEAQVKVWFQNRRIKWRKHHLELTHQRLAAIKQQQLQQQILGEAVAHTDTLDSNGSTGTDT